MGNFVAASSITILTAAMLLFGGTHPAAAARVVDHSCAQGQVIEGVVASGNAMMFRLAGDDRTFSLAQLVPYRKPSGNLKQWHGTKVQLFPSAEKPDRYGRLPVQAFLGPDATRQWLQGWFLEEGQALFDGKAADDACSKAMLRAERAAFNEGKGVWVSSRTIRFRSHEVEDILEASGRLVVVEGRVLSVGDRKRRLYLNFGRKWREDFTIIADKKGKSAFKGDMGTLQAAKGSFIRVRGIVEMSGGPMIKVTHGAQLQIHER